MKKKTFLTDPGRYPHQNKSARKTSAKKSLRKANFVKGTLS